MGCRLLRWQRTNHLANPFPGPPPPPGGLSTIELRCSHCQERMWCWGHRGCFLRRVNYRHCTLATAVPLHGGEKGLTLVQRTSLFFSPSLASSLFLSLALPSGGRFLSSFFFSLFLSVLFSLSPASSPSVLSTNCREGDVMLPCDFSVSAVCGVKSA